MADSDNEKTFSEEFIIWLGRIKDLYYIPMTKKKKNSSDFLAQKIYQITMLDFN